MKHLRPVHTLPSDPAVAIESVAAQVPGRRQVLRLGWLGIASSPLLAACGGAKSDRMQAFQGGGPPSAAAPLKPSAGGGTQPRAPVPAAAPAPLNLTGDLWAPNRGPGAAVLVSDFEHLPMRRWLRVASNKLDDVIPRPRYPTYVGNEDGSPNIVAAWSGAGWDYISQRMYLSGGGHADSHYCENGIYELAADTLLFSEIVRRSPLAATQYWYEAQKRIVPGLSGQTANAPLADGTVPASHTYDALVWVPGAVAGNERGALVMFHDVVGVVDLDSRRYDTLHYNGPSPVDLSYKNCEMDGWTLLHMRNGNQYRRWDLRPSVRSKTLHSNNSRGAYLGTVDAGADLVYGLKLMVRMPQRRENVVLSGSANTRFRYGRALDSGSAGPWGMFHDRITLESADGSHTLFNNPAQWLLATPSTPLFAAGGTFDHQGQCIWVQTNLAGGPLFKITGLDTNRWQVEQVPGVAAISTNINGTYQRCQLFVKGAARCLLRVSSTTGYPEVCRVA
jgi:hypothetical protein